MKPDGSGDAGFDRLVREALRNAPPAAEPCPPASELAAFLEGAVSAEERAGFERHLAACERCQDTLARAASTVPAARPVRSRRWLPAVPFRWLLPAGAVAAAAALTYLVVAPTLPRRSPAVATLEVAQHAAGPRSEEASPPAAPAAGQAAPTTAVPVPAPVGRKAGSAAELEKGERPPRAADREAGFAPAPPAKPGATGDERAKAHSDRARAAAVGGVAGGAVGGVVAGAAPPPSPVNAAEARENVANAPPLVPYESRQTVAKGQAPGQVQGLAAADRAQAPPPAPQQAPAPAREAQPPVVQPAAPPAARVAGAAERPTRADAARAPRGVAMAESIVATGATSFASPRKSVLWRIDPSGAVFRSADGGTTWEEQRAGTGAVFLSGSAPTETACWLVGRLGALAVTSDGGRWAHPAFPEAVDLVRVEARDASRAVVTTRDGRRFETGDAGASWRLLR